MTRFVVVADGSHAADLVLGVLPPELAKQPSTRVLDRDPVDRIGPRLLELTDDETVVLLDSSQSSRDLAGWLATVAGARVSWAVERVEVGGDCLRVARVVNGGDALLLQELDRSAPAVLLTKRRAPAKVADGRRLETARVVVAVGRGIGGPEHVGLFRALAEALGAALGASRVVVDQGWLPFSHQVGQTGAAVAPELYLGFGVSGSVQHVVGMRDSRTIVAVNTDRQAPLCDIADVVVEADAVEVARALLAELEEGAAR